MSGGGKQAKLIHCQQQTVHVLEAYPVHARRRRETYCPRSDSC